MSSYIIYIPTFGREKQVTYDSLPPELQDRVLFVVHPDEAEWFHKRKLAHMVCPVQGRGAGVVRDWIMGMTRQLVVIMLDDDISFKSGPAFKKASETEIIDGFNRLVESAAVEPKVFFTSLGSTFFNDGEKDWDKNGRFTHSFFINRALAEKHKLSFLGVPTMEDVWFSLQGLTKGLENRIFLQLCATSSPNGTGGEALGGDRGQRHERAALILKERYPKFVTIRESKNAVHLKNIGTTTDITVRWKQAAKYGKENGYANVQTVR